MLGRMPQIGKPAPAFTTTALLDETFRELSLDQFKGKYVVLFFYPNNCVPLCFDEVIAFSNRLAEFRKINCEVLCVSGATDCVNRTWWESDFNDDLNEFIKYPLLHDRNHKIATDYGLPTIIDLWGSSYCGLFIINDEGILVHISISKDDVVCSVDETIRLVRASQFGDKHGEVCPAGSAAGSLALLRARQLGRQQFRFKLRASWITLRRPTRRRKMGKRHQYPLYSSHRTVSQAADVMSELALQISEYAPTSCTEALVGTTFKQLQRIKLPFRQKYIVIIFYPADFSVICLDEIIAFSDRLAEFKEIKCRVLGVSADPCMFLHLACLNARRKADGIGPIKIPLVDDTNHKIATDYGMYTLDGTSSRGLIIVGEEMCVRHIMKTHSLLDCSVDETLRLIHTFQRIDDLE